MAGRNIRRCVWAMTTYNYDAKQLKRQDNGRLLRMTRRCLRLVNGLPCKAINGSTGKMKSLKMVSYKTTNCPLVAEQIIQPLYCPVDIIGNWDPLKMML